jgi:acetylxylan esterase
MHLQILAPVLTLCSRALAAELSQVSNYGGSARAKPGMFVTRRQNNFDINGDHSARWVYVPDQVKSDALVVAIHSCQSSAQKYFQNDKIPWKKGSDTKGYVTVWPSSTTECWDVSSKSSLSNNGGGDSNAIANMITYAIDKYKNDPKKVFVTGGSSGGSSSRIPVVSAR